MTREFFEYKRVLNHGEGIEAANPLTLTEIISLPRVGALDLLLMELEDEEEIGETQPRRRCVNENEETLHERNFGNHP